ncbi:MAG: lysoplasmalogenase [Bacteroidales bacterium]|nr:lysoplasmalogenase [Bacteroidales bacterium]
MLCLTVLVREDGRRILPWPMAFAFLFSGMGDCMGADRNLIMQIAYFGLAHACIIYYNIRVTRRRGVKFLRGEMWPMYLFVALILVLALTMVYPHVETSVLKGGVMAYIVLISTMAVSAASVGWASKVFWPVLGGVLFLVSDFTLAGEKFVSKDFFMPTFLVMPTYYGALLSLWLGSSEGKLEKNC